MRGITGWDRYQPVLQEAEGKLGRVLVDTVSHLWRKFDVTQCHEREWKLENVVNRFKTYFSEVEYFYCFDTSAIRPDGGYTADGRE